MSGFDSSDHVLIQRLTEIVLTNLSDENFGVSELAKEIGLNYFSLNRRLHSILNTTTSKFICEIRLKRAKEVLEQEAITASEVAFRVGFSSPTYFSKCFHDYFGFPPGEIKKRGLSDNKESNDESLMLSDKEEVFENSRLNQSPGRKLRKKGMIISGTIIFILGILLIGYFPRILNKITRLLNPEDMSIVVLPFRNLSKEDDYLYFAEGVTGSILNNLTHIEKLKVISLVSSEIDKTNDQSSLDIVKKMKVGYILSGSVQYQSDRFLILVELTETKYNLQIWSGKMEGEISDIFNAQGDIAKNIANELQTVLSQREIKQISKIPTRNIVAYSHYLKGCYFLNRRNLDAGIDYFNKAIAVDPNYAEAYAGLADAIFSGTKGKWYPRTVGYEKTKINLKRALALDNNLAEAHATLGSLLCFSEWNWEEARKEFLEAISLNPNSAAAHQYYGEYLLITRQLAGAREHLSISCELDPTTSVNLILSARCYMSEGKFPEALEECRKMIELDPKLHEAYFFNFYIYNKTGEESKAVDAIEHALSILEVDKKYSVKVREVYHRSGMTGLLEMLLGYEAEDPEFGILGSAKLYCFLKKNDKALDCLEKAMLMEKRYPDLPLINCDIDFEQLRGEPRFQALLKKMGLTYSQTISGLHKLPR